MKVKTDDVIVDDDTFEIFIIDAIISFKNIHFVRIEYKNKVTWFKCGDLSLVDGYTLIGKI
jgi:hypothetical protein